MKKTLLVLSLVSAVFLSATSSVAAQYYVPGVTPAKQIFINKLVQNPQTGQFIDNLGQNDPRFSPNQTVNFQIQVKNTGNADLVNITVSDKLPSFIESVSGPGTIDVNTRTLSFNVDSLKVNEIKTYTISAKVMDAPFVPDNQVNCVLNIAEARVEGLFSQDSAQFCIEERITGQKGEILPAVTELPVTGPEHVLIVLLGSLSALTLAFYFYRKATK